MLPARFSRLMCRGSKARWPITRCWPFKVTEPSAATGTVWVGASWVCGSWKAGRSVAYSSPWSPSWPGRRSAAAPTVCGALCGATPGFTTSATTTVTLSRVPARRATSMRAWAASSGVGVSRRICAIVSSRT